MTKKKKKKKKKKKTTTKKQQQKTKQKNKKKKKKKKTIAETTGTSLKLHVHFAVRLRMIYNFCSGPEYRCSTRCWHFLLEV